MLSRLEIVKGVENIVELRIENAVKLFILYGAFVGHYFNSVLIAFLVVFFKPARCGHSFALSHIFLPENVLSAQVRGFHCIHIYEMQLFDVFEMLEVVKQLYSDTAATYQ